MELPKKNGNPEFTPLNPKEFDNQEIAGVKVSDYFNFKAREYEWLQTQKTYPAWLDRKRIHKVILKLPSATEVDAANGDKWQYLSFQAFHIETKYGHGAFIRNKYFPMLFPLKAFIKMWNEAVLYGWEPYKHMMVEVHFSKKTKNTYEMYYLAQVRQLEPHSFERLDVIFKKDKYTGDKIKDDTTNKTN